MVLLNLYIHYTIWYLDIIFPISSSEHPVCSVYFDFSMGVGLSPDAVPVHRLGLLWLSCGFVNRLRSLLSNWRLVNLISGNLIFFFSVLSSIPQGSPLRPLGFKISVSLILNAVTYIRYLFFAYYILFPVFNSTNLCTLLQSGKECRKG